MGRSVPQRDQRLLLRPWAGAPPHLVDASREAGLVVVGCRNRSASVGAHIGPVTQAVLHHSTAPVGDARDLWVRIDEEGITGRRIAVR